MSYYPNPNRHVYASSSSHRVSMRPNLSWSTIREESSADLLASEVDEKRDRINRLKKLERLKERRYMDYQSLKRRGSSKEYSERFQRDCEEFNKLKYRQVHHTPNSMLSLHSKNRSASVSDFTARRQHLLYGSRYGHTSYLRGNQDDGQTLSPAGSISSIVTLDDDYMYGSRYAAEDNWASWRPRSRTSSMSMSRDRLGHYGLSSHEMLDDNLFDDTSSEYSYSGYVPQRRAFSSCVTPRKYSGMMTPTAQSADAQATVERMNQLSERLKLLQTERVHLERRRSVDLGSSQARSDLSSLDHTDTASASVHGRFSQNSQTTILPKSPTDHSIPSWSQRVNLLLSSRHHDVPDSDTEYSSSHIETSPSYTTSSRHHSEILDSTHSSYIQNYSRQSQDTSYRSPTLRSDTLSRSFIYQRPESSSTPTSEMRQERVSVHSPSYLSMTSTDTRYGSSPTDASYEHEDGQQFHTTHSNIQHITNITDTQRTINLQQPRYTSSKTEYSTHLLRDGQFIETGANLNKNSQRTTRETNYTSDLSPSPLSPGSQNKNFVNLDTKTIIIRHGQQGSETTTHDDVSDSGVDSSSELGRVSNSVSSDSISKFVVSASKPSESRGRSKFEISLGSSDQRAGGSELSPNESTHHSVQEGTTRDGLDSTSYHTTTRTTYKYGGNIQTTVTEQNNRQSGQYDTVQSDKAISDVANVVTRKEKTIEVEHPAAKKTAMVNVEMNVSEPNNSGASFVSENQFLDRSQQQSTKTKVIPQTTVSIQKKQVSSDMLYAETKPSPTATLKMVTKGSEEFVEKPSQPELQNQSFDIRSGQNSSESVTSGVKTTYHIDSTDARNKGSRADVRNDNSSIFDRTNSETVRESTTTTIVKTVNNLSTETMETTEQVSGNNIQYNQNNVQKVTSADPMNYTSQVSETAPLVRKTETIEIHSKSSNDKNTNNFSKTLPSNQKGTAQIVFKTNSDKLESAEVQKSVQISGPNVSQSVQKNGSSGIVESAVSKEPDVTDPSVATPKKKKSKKKKSLKNGLDSQTKPEEPTSTMETSVDLELSSSAIDGKNGQPKVPISSQQVTQKELDNVTKTTKSQEKTVSITTQKSSEVYQNGTKDKSGGIVIKQSTDLKQQQPVKDTSDARISEQSVNTKNLDINVVESEVDVSRSKRSKNQAVTTPSKQPQTNGKNGTQVEVGTVQLKSPQKTKSSKSEVTISKEEFQTSPTDGATTVTIVKTKHLMDATRETLENLQSGDQKSWGEVNKDKTPSPVSSKLVTTSYQMISSVDNVSTQEPSKRNKKKVEKNIEHYLGLESSTDVSSQKTEETVVTESSSGKSKKKKKNSSKGKEDKQSENFSKESDQFPRQAEDKKTSESKEQSNLSEKVITTSTTKTTISKTSETPEKYNIKSASAEFPSQGPQQTEFTQSNLADKTAPTIKMTAHKMAPGMSERSEEYHVQSISAEFPNQGPQQSEFTQGNLANKTAHTIKMAGHKMAPGISDMSEEYKKTSVSAEFPGQQTGLGKDGEIITKVTTTTKTTSYDVDSRMLSGPEAYNVQSKSFPGKTEDTNRAGFQEQGDAFSKVTTTTKTFGYKTSESSEEYNVQNMSAEFPGQVKVPQQMEFTQGNMVDKVATVTKSAAYKMAPGMSDRPEEYHVQSVSAVFPGQESQTSNFTQGNLAEKTAPAIKPSANKMAPGISDKPVDNNIQSFSVEFPGQPTGVGKDDEIVTKVTTVTETTYVDSGSNSKDLAQTKKSGKPQKLNIPSISLEAPEEDSLEKEPEKSSFFGRVASTIKNTFSRVSPVSPLSPVSPNKPETAIPSFSDIPADSSVDPIQNTTEQTSVSTKPMVKDGSALASVKPDIQTSGKKVTAKPSDSERVTLKNIASKSKSGESVKTESFKESVVTESTEQSGIDSRVTTVTKTVTCQISDKSKENNIQSLSTKQPGHVEMSQAAEQGDVSRKLVTTTVKSTVSQAPKGQYDNSVQSISPEFPGQVKSHQQTEFTQGNVMDKVATTVKTVAYKASEMPEEYKAESVSVKFPGEKSEFKTEEMVTKVTTMTEITPETYNSRSVSAEFPNQATQQSEFTQSNLADKTAPTIKMTAHKMAPGMSDRPEYHHVQSVSAEFPSQGPQQSEFTQSNLADKTAPTVKMTAHKMAPGMSDRPEEYHVQSISAKFPSQGPQQSEFTQGNLADKTAHTIKMAGHKMAPGISDMSEEYKKTSVSAEFPGQQTGLGKDGEIITKVTTTTKTTSYDVDSRMLSGPEAYNVQSKSFPGKTEDTNRAGFQEQGDAFSKVTTTTKTFGYKTSESSEEYNVQNMSAEFPGQVKAPQQMEFTQGNMVDKVATVTKSAAYKMAPGMSDRPEEYNVQSVSAEFPGQLKSPKQTDFTQGNIVDKVTTTTVSTSYKIVPEISDNAGELKAPSVSVEFPDRVSTTQSNDQVTISAKMDPEVSKNQDPYQISSSLPKGTEVVQQGDMFSKVVKTSTDIVYKTDKTISEKSEELKTQTVSVEFPGMQTKAGTTNKTTAKKGKEEMPAETQKQKPQGKANTASKKGHKKTSEKSEEPDSETVSSEMANQSKDKQKKEKSGFLGKVATSLRSSFSKKSAQPANSEEFPELVKDSSGDLKIPTVTSESQRTTYKSVVESSTVSPTIKTTLQGNTEDLTVNKHDINLKTDSVDSKTIATKTVDYRAVTEITDKNIELPRPVKGHQQTDLSEATKDVEVVKTTTNVTEERISQSVSAGMPVEKKDPNLFGSKEQTNLSEKFVTTSTTRTTITKTSETPEEYNIGSVSAVFPGQSLQQSEFTQGNLADRQVPTINMAAHKMAPGMSDRPEYHHVQSVSAEFPSQGSQQSEFTQSNLADKTVPTIKMTAHKMAPGMSDRFEEYHHVQSISAEFPSQGLQQSEFTQSNLADKTAPTIKMTAHKMAPGMSDRSEYHHVQSISAEFPSQGPQQSEFTQGNLADKTAHTIKMAGHKMAPGISDMSEEYKESSVSAEFPGQQTEFGKDGEIITKVTTTTKTTSYDVDSRMLSGPEAYNVHSKSFPGKTEDTNRAGFQEQGDAFSKVTTTTKTFGYKTSESSEEYNVQNMSAEFPGQVKVPQQMEFTQGNMVDKVATVTKSAAYKMAPGMSEQYHVQSVSAQFPGQGPQQTEITQDNVADKTVKMAAYKMIPGMSEKLEEYNVQSVSAEFPGQLKSPIETDFTQGNTADKVATTTVSSTYKMSPEMTGELKVPSLSAEFPGLGKDPKHDGTGICDTQTHTSQISYKSVLERGMKPVECALPTSTQSADISIDVKNSHPDISYTLSKDQPYLRTTSLETSHFTLEKPVTTVRTITKTVTTDLTDSPVDLSTGVSVNTGITQLQHPTNTLSQDDSRYVVPSTSMEFSENLKSSETDSSVSYSTDFSTTSLESAPMIRQKSWSDVVKAGKTADVGVERSQSNIASSISIDKVEKPGDRSSHLQQTENEGRIMSGGSQAFVMSKPKDTSLHEYADISSGDVISPLKAKPMPSSKPLLRKLSGQDFSVADVQRSPKPTLKLVAPDCLLLQTKFETDGYKPKIKSPTTTMTTTTTIVKSELISQSPTDTANLEHGSAPVAPKRRSREFRNVSEDNTEGEAASLTLHLKSQGEISPSTPQSPQPQVPKRRQKKGSKNDRNSSSSVSPDTPKSKNFNISHPEFRASDQDVFHVSLPSPTSPTESETKQNLITEKKISLNKSPHTLTTSDSGDVGGLQEIKMKTPKVAPQHPDFIIDDSPIEKNPPFERSYSADKSRTMPLHRKKLTSDSNNSDSDGEEKQHEPLSPASKQKRWKSVEFLKDTRVNADVPPKNTGLNRVKSTSIKLLSKLQPKSKKSKSPGPDKNIDDYSPDPHDKTGRGATREYPNLEKYPVRQKSRRRGNKEPSSLKTPKSEETEAEAAAAPVAPLRIPLLLEENDEPVKERVYLHSWDPTPLLKELYEIRLMDDNTEDLSHKFIEMEGLMEKLPMNKKKATLLKTWKRRYFRAKNGWLIYFDNRNDEKPSDEVLLMGGHVHAIGNHVIGIDDGRGRYLMVRCPSQKEYEQWLTALQSQTTDNTRATYIRPSMNALKHPSKKIVMIEFGSMSIRAGILKEHATLPQLFFPNIVAVSQENGITKHVIGFDAYKPEVRHSSQLVRPFGPTDKVDKLKLDFETLPSVFTAIFQDLKIATAEYYVMLILPLNIIDDDKSTLMNILIDQFKVYGVCMAPQALLSLYSYNAQSGIIVDIGERLEVLPIYEGFVIDGGHTVQSFGAPKIRQSLRSGLTSENYPLYSPLEQLLVRLVMEQTCYVSKNFNKDCQQYQRKPEKFKETLYLKKYNLPEETYNVISHSLSRFVSPEGLFNTDLWGMDYPTIQSLVKNAIEACPMDNRRHLCRSIYLSGGVTLLPGFASRLEAELSKHLNETIVIQVHASSQRYHAAYIGACALCSMPEFEKSCITSEEWKSEGTKAFQKWKMSS